MRVTPPPHLRTAYHPFLALRTAYRNVLASHTAYRLTTKNDLFKVKIDICVRYNRISTYCDRSFAYCVRSKLPRHEYCVPKRGCHPQKLFVIHVVTCVVCSLKIKNLSQNTCSTKHTAQWTYKSH